jgi:hypothetical protein
MHDDRSCSAIHCGNSDEYRSLLVPPGHVGLEGGGEIRLVVYSACAWVVTDRATDAPHDSIGSPGYQAQRGSEGVDPCMNRVSDGMVAVCKLAGRSRSDTTL